MVGVPVERPKEVLTAEDIARRERNEALRQQQEPGRDVNIVWDEPETKRKIQQPSLGSYRGGGKDMSIVERFTLVDENTIDYRAEFDDPRAFTRPWTLGIPLIRDDSYVIYEYACHEGNYGLEHILSAAFKDR